MLSENRQNGFLMQLLGHHLVHLHCTQSVWGQVPALLLCLPVTVRSGKQQVREFGSLPNGWVTCIEFLAVTCPSCGWEIPVWFCLSIFQTNKIDKETNIDLEETQHTAKSSQLVQRRTPVWIAPALNPRVHSFCNCNTRPSQCFRCSGPHTQGSDNKPPCTILQRTGQKESALFCEGSIYPKQHNGQGNILARNRTMKFKPNVIMNEKYSTAWLASVSCRSAELPWFWNAHIAQAKAQVFIW